jgi:maltoporin
MHGTLKRLMGFLVATGLASGAQALPIDLHGYFRTGGGTSTKGGANVCYRLPGGMMVNNFGFRLGNECDMYVTLDSNLALGEVSGTKFRGVLNIAYGTNQAANWEQSVPAFRQAYVAADGIGSGAFEKSSVWLGKRFYGYTDFYITDYTWWEVNTGPGVGIEGINTGFGKLAIAALWSPKATYDASKDFTTFRADLADAGATGAVTADVRLSEIPLYPGGSLTIGGDLIFQTNRAVNVGDATASLKGTGVMVAAQWKHEFPGLGNNQVVLQGATGAANLTGSANVGMLDNQTFGGWRVMDALFIQPEGSPFAAFLFAGYQVSGDDKKDKGFSVGGRPWYHFNDLLGVLAEVGYTSMTPGQDGSQTRSLLKATVAGEISMGKSFWARPALRLYYTYASWNDAAKAAGPVACTGRDCSIPVKSYDNSTSGSTIGAQLEAWW